MPCRALEAFGLKLSLLAGQRTLDPVLMPCRALEAFGLKQEAKKRGAEWYGLNALSGIGGVRTSQDALEAFWDELV